MILPGTHMTITPTVVLPSMTQIARDVDLVVVHMQRSHGINLLLIPNCNDHRFLRTPNLL